MSNRVVGLKSGMGVAGRIPFVAILAIKSKIHF